MASLWDDATDPYAQQQQPDPSSLLGWLHSMLGNGDPEGQGAAAASTAMEPVTGPYLHDVVTGQAALDSLQRNFGRPSDAPSDPYSLATSPGLMDQAQNIALGFAGPGSFRIYHGSPHDFAPTPSNPLGEFSDAKIGTGEGAQAIAYGHYGAEAEPVAREYRDNLSSGAAFDTIDNFLKSNKGANLSPEDIASKLQGTRAAVLTQDPRAIKAMRDLLPNYDPGAAVSNADLGNYRYLNDAAERLLKGKMYEVNVDAESKDFLDWDKSAADQSPNVINALNQIWKENGGTLEGRTLPPFAAHSETTGSGIHAALSTTLGSEQAAAKALSDHGVPGVRYYDQLSRNAGGWHITPPNMTVSGKWMVKSNDYNSQGMHFDTEAEAQKMLQEKIGSQTHNYVVFDPSKMDIARKYAVPGLITGGAAMGAANTNAGNQ